MRGAWFLTPLAFVLGCSHDPATAGDAGVTTASTANAANAASAPDAAGAKTATAAAPSSSATTSATSFVARTVSGKYTAVKSTFTLPSSATVKWRGEDDASGLGPGTVTLQIAADGRVSGSVAGALGDLVALGMDRDGELTAQLTPKKGAPIDSFTGTLLAKDDGKSVTGTMRLSDGTNRLLREAPITAGP